MDSIEPRIAPFHIGVQDPQNNEEASEMHQYPYISVVGSLMYLSGYHHKAR
jgi:hypothetical protein